MDYQAYYSNQLGNGDFVYSGRRYQKGHGLGNLLGSLFRTALPMIKNTAKTVGKELVKSSAVAGQNALSDIIAGGSVKDSLKRRFVEEGQELINKRLKPNKTPSHNARPHSRRRVVAQKRHKDIFG